jgi:hypothetical protein
MQQTLPTLSIFVEVYRTGREESTIKSSHKHIIMPNEGDEDMAKDDKSPVEWTGFNAGLTVPTSVKFTMIRFDVAGKARNAKTFLKYAGPQIKGAINEIAKECGLEPVFTI